MNRTWKQSFVVVLGVTAVFGALALSRSQPAIGAEQGAQSGSPHYTVLETDGHNLVVTDNATDTVYFYTVDKGQHPGADLKLRATVNLKDVGKAVIKPKDINVQK